jgi:hypothetical protein
VAILTGRCELSSSSKGTSITFHSPMFNRNIECKSIISSRFVVGHGSLDRRESHVVLSSIYFPCLASNWNPQIAIPSTFIHIRNSHSHSWFLLRSHTRSTSRLHRNISNGTRGGIHEGRDGDGNVENEHDGTWSAIGYS